MWQLPTAVDFHLFFILKQWWAMKSGKRWKLWRKCILVLFPELRPTTVKLGFLMRKPLRQEEIWNIVVIYTILYDHCFQLFNHSYCLNIIVLPAAVFTVYDVEKDVPLWHVLVTIKLTVANTEAVEVQCFSVGYSCSSSLFLAVDIACLHEAHSCRK